MISNSDCSLQNLVDRCQISSNIESSQDVNQASRIFDNLNTTLYNTINNQSCDSKCN